MTVTKERKSELAAVANALEEARKVLGWSLRKAEEHSKVSNGYISQVEQGVVRPSPDVLLKLCSAYGLPYERLLIEAGYLAPKDPEATDTIPAWMLSVSTVLQPEDWEQAQIFFETLRKSRAARKK